MPIKLFRKHTETIQSMTAEQDASILSLSRLLRALKTKDLYYLKKRVNTT
jgi:hypothetical protein